MFLECIITQMFNPNGFQKKTKRWCIECNKWTVWEYKIWKKHSQCTVCKSWSTKARKINPVTKKLMDPEYWKKRCDMPVEICLTSGCSMRVAYGEGFCPDCLRNQKKTVKEKEEITNE